MIRMLAAETGKLLLKVVLAIIVAIILSYLVYVLSLKAMRNMVDTATGRLDQTKALEQRDNATTAITGKDPRDRSEQ